MKYLINYLEWLELKFGTLGKDIIHFLVCLIIVGAPWFLSRNSILNKQITFDEVIEYTLKYEGGYVNDAVDLGGETKYGISKASHPDVDIENLNVEQAKKIYRDKYWKENLYSKIKHPKIIKKHFDTSVMMGHKQTTILLQRALNSCQQFVEIDGDFGRLTAEAVNRVDEKALLFCYIGELANYFRDVVQFNKLQARFLKGWNIRCYDDYDVDTTAYQ